MSRCDKHVWATRATKDEFSDLSEVAAVAKGRSARRLQPGELVSWLSIGLELIVV